MKKNVARPIVFPSTKAFLREARAAGLLSRGDYSLWDFIHGYVYARWPYQYIAIAKGDHPFSKSLARLYGFRRKLFPGKSRSRVLPSTSRATHTIADGYHGKAMPLKQVIQLVSINKSIHLPDLEQVIPYVRARALIVQNPHHMVALDCPCRASSASPCAPLDVCLIIGEPFASFIAEHHPHRSRWIGQDEALAILEAENRRGHVHHAFFKDAMLGRFFAICNCCPCCCGAIKAHKNGIPMLASSGYVSSVTVENCLGCGECVPRCPFDALEMEENHAAVNEDRCMGCGICVDQCAQGAISLLRSPQKGKPLELGVRVRS